MVDVAAFERMTWQDDRMLLGDLVFRLHHFRRDDWELGDACFALIKTPPLMRDYARLFAAMPDVRSRNVLELGMWDGGSVALWYELLRPDKLVGVDVTRHDDSDYFRRYVERNDLSERLSTYWGTDQADAGRLREIVATEFDGPLDLVIDDASHIDGPTRASFEALFPLLRTGGLYIIEDWAWEYWPSQHGANNPLASENPPTQLVHDILGAVGSHARGAARSLTAYSVFVAIERGWAELPLDGFVLGEWLTPRSPQ